MRKMTFQAMKHVPIEDVQSAGQHSRIIKYIINLTKAIEGCQNVMIKTKK